LCNFQVGDFPISKVNIKKIKKLVKETDLVFLQTISILGCFTVHYAKKYKKPLVTYKHTLEWELVPKAFNKHWFYGISELITKFFVRKMYKKCDLIICPSKSIAEKLAWHKIKTKTAIVHIGVNYNKFKPPANKKDAKESVGLNPNNIIIGYHGRIAPEKNLLMFGRTHKRILRKYKNISYLIVGDGLKEIKDKLKKKDIEVISSKNNVVPYLQAMDIYVMPSLAETSCLSLIEAMSCSLPVVTSKVGMIPDYVKNGDNGFLINKKDSFHLIKNIEKLVENKKLRTQTGAHARETIKFIFDWDKTAKKLIKLLNGFV
jgi:glycosyltransferase involved in cell wall biosynthesis